MSTHIAPDLYSSSGRSKRPLSQFPLQLKLLPHEFPLLREGRPEYFAAAAFVPKETGKAAGTGWVRSSALSNQALEKATTRTVKIRVFRSMKAPGPGYGGTVSALRRGKLYQSKLSLASFIFIFKNILRNRKAGGERYFYTGEKTLSQHPGISSPGLILDGMSMTTLLFDKWIRSIIFDSRGVPGRLPA